MRIDRFIEKYGEGLRDFDIRSVLSDFDIKKDAIDRIKTWNIVRDFDGTKTLLWGE